MRSGTNLACVIAFSIHYKFSCNLQSVSNCNILLIHFFLFRSVICERTIMTSSEDQQPDTLDIIDKYQQDDDSVTSAELSDLFLLKYQTNKKVTLTEGLHTSNSFVNITSNKDESQIAAANKKGDVSIVDACNGTRSSCFQAHSKEVTGLRFCPTNPNILYSSSLDYTIKLRDLRTNKFEQTYTHKDEEGKGKQFTCLDVNCSGEFLCSGTSLTRDEDAYLVFWDVRKTEMLGGYSESHSDDITCVRFHPTKRQTLASAAMDNLINIYDISKKSESDAFNQCINFETTPDAVYWDPHSDHESKLFAVNYPQIIQYWDVEDTVPRANLGAKKLCKAMKRQRPDQCHLISLNFDKYHNPLISVSSNLNCDSHENTCIRGLRYDRDTNKLAPHSTLELVANNKMDVVDTLYLPNTDAFITLESGTLRYWVPRGGHKRQQQLSSSATKIDNKKRKH